LPDSVQGRIDVVFAMMDEPQAAANLARLSSLLPNNANLIVIRNTRGFAPVLLAAQQAMQSDCFFLVDADAHILDSFQFVPPAELSSYTCCIYRAVNPVNGLSYGHGGVKAYRRKALFETIGSGVKSYAGGLERLLDILDFPSGGSRHFLAAQANIHEFNTSPLHAWRSAFREVAKLRYISRQTASRSTVVRFEEWIYAWKNKGEDQRFGEDTIQGARHGDCFGGVADEEAILLINDYSFLGRRYDDARRRL
jgi:hypothetical protein